MFTVRVRSLVWFGSGVAVCVALFVAMLAWRASALPGPSESTVVAVTPTRIMDTRDPVNLGLAGPFVSPTGQKLQVTGTIPIAGGGTSVVVPVGATGVLLNVTVVRPQAAGFVSVRPGDASGAPSTSSLNFAAGADSPNSVQVSLPSAGANAGKIDIVYDALGAAGPTTDILVDVVGYTTSAGIQDLVAEIGAMQTLTLDAYSSLSTNTSDGAAGCLQFSTGSGGSARLSLPLPAGASITSVKVRFNDQSAGSSVNALLRYSVPGLDGIASNSVQSAGGFTSDSLVLDGDAAAPPTSINKMFNIVASAPAHAGSLSFCGAAVTYTVDSTFTAPLVEASEPTGVVVCDAVGVCVEQES